MKHSKTTLICMFSFLLTGMISCTKISDIEPNGSIESKLANTKTEILVGMFMSGDEVLLGESAYFEPFIYIPDGSAESVNCGKLVLQKQNSKTKNWEDVKDAQYSNLYSALYTIPAVSYSDSGYYRWHYIASGNCSFKSVFGGSLYLNVVKEYTEVIY